MLNDTVQALLALSQKIAQQSPDGDLADEMRSLVQVCADKLRLVETKLPLTLKRNQVLLAHLQKLDAGSQKCQRWFSDAQHILNRYTLQLPVKRMEDYLAKHHVSTFLTSLYTLRINYLARLSSLTWIRTKPSWTPKQH